MTYEEIEAESASYQGSLIGPGRQYALLSSPFHSVLVSPLLSTILVVNNSTGTLRYLLRLAVAWPSNLQAKVAALPLLLLFLASTDYYIRKLRGVHSQGVI